MSAYALPSPFVDRLPSAPRKAHAQWVEVATLSQSPPWLASALRAVTDLGRLGNDWDGYGSPPLAHESLKSAREVLGHVGDLDVPWPEVAPVTGGVFFHWQLGAREVEVEVLPNGTVDYLLCEGLEGADETSRERRVLSRLHLSIG